MKCVITGISFTDGEHYISGDLFQTDGGTWVFNANTDITEKGVEIKWQDDSFYTKQCRADRWWEKRGVFIFEQSDLRLNEVARKYLGGN